MPFEFTINPYRGCEFACHYCYARYTHEFLELRDPHEFESKIFAKQFNPDLLRQDLRRMDPSKRIALGTATDPYQPAERRFEVTRRVLEILARFEGLHLGIVTKSDLITRDLDLLETIGHRSSLSVNITVTTVDAKLARLLEPRAPRPDLRLRTVRILRQAGIETGVLCCPLLPLINDSEPQLDSLARAVAAAGAQWLHGNVLYLPQAARGAWFPFLAKQFPHLARKYRDHFHNSVYLRGPYVDMVKERLRRVRKRHRFEPRSQAAPAVVSKQMELW